MGSCFGHCLNGRSRRAQRAQRTKYFRASDSVEFDFLVDNEPPPLSGRRERKPAAHGGISYLLAFNRNKRRPLHSVQQDVSATNSVGSHFQPLDARSLLARDLMSASRTSTPASANSLDLEWENEGGMPMQTYHSSLADSTRGATSTWSRLSSPDSLEWDPIEAEIVTSSLDVETEQLLSEIERLTSRALRETGDGTS